MQKTDFGFEVLIHDDASTDGTTDVIREYEAKYPDIIKPIYQTENQYKKGRGLSIGNGINVRRARGKYIAECEGDDFWTDPYKLQKQVDFLEANPDYGFIGTGFNFMIEDGEGWIEKPGPADGDYVRNRIINYGGRPLNPECRGNVVLYGDLLDYAKMQPLCHTASVVYRKSLVEGVNDKLAGDYVLQIILAHSKYAYLKDITCDFRIYGASLSHNISPEGRLKLHPLSVYCHRVLTELYPDEFSAAGLDLLSDHENYLRLKVAIKSFNYREARQCKAAIKFDSNRKLNYSKLFHGPISFAILHLSLRFKSEINSFNRRFPIFYKAYWKLRVAGSKVKKSVKKGRG